MSLNGLTCLSCRVSFANALLQRDHYRSDWHRYNLKRKVAQLPPVSAEHYSKIETHQQSVAQEAKQKESFYCEKCRKQFGKQKAFDQHNQSKKHLESGSHPNRDVDSKKNVPDTTVKQEKPALISALPQSDSDSDWESVESSDEELDGENDGKERENNVTPIPPNVCLFCNMKHDALEKNVEHMSSKHSFFIPDPEYLVDLKGLITYLGEKVGIGFRCLWCCDSGKGFKTLVSVQKHMLDKGHTKMKHEKDTLLEYAGKLLNKRRTINKF